MAKDISSLYPGRKDFERGANLLKEGIEKKRIFFSAGVSSQTADSLKRVRILPNGRLNLFTVDELVRSNFHMLVSGVLNTMHERKE
jgi:hypothetical protein